MHTMLKAEMLPEWSYIITSFNDDIVSEAHGRTCKSAPQFEIWFLQLVTFLFLLLIKNLDILREIFIFALKPLFWFSKTLELII